MMRGEIVAREYKVAGGEALGVIKVLQTAYEKLQPTTFADLLVLADPRE